MEKYNNWGLKFYIIWAGQAVSLITAFHYPALNLIIALLQFAR